MLEVGPADDRYEREADQVADAVVQSLRSGAESDAVPVADAESSRIQPSTAARSINGNRDDPVRRASRIQRAPAVGPEGGVLDADTERSVRSATGGRPLDAPVRAQMEQAFGADFGDVRLHRNSDLAPKLGARAFTTGSAIHVAPGEAREGTPEGQRLLSHELTHVMQQRPSVRTDRAAPVQRSPIGYIQRLAYSDKPTTWPKNVTVSRSGEGAKGVFFVKAGADKIVLKPLKSVGNVEFANKVMEDAGLNFEAPQSVSYKKGDAEGGAIKDLLLANADKGRDPKEIPDQVASAKYFMVMSLVQGKSIQTLDDDEAHEFLMNANALEGVGRLMVADAFLGNGDRLISNANLGNFFYVAAGTLHGKVTTIDNDSSFKAATIDKKGKLKGELDNKMHIIEALLDKTQRFGWIKQFLAKFAQVHAKHPTALQALNDFRATIESDVSKGIDNGFTEMAAAFTTDIGLVHALGKTTDKSDASNTMDVDAAKSTAQYIKMRMSGKDAKTARADLTKYVKYRAKRNRTWYGFKWVTKLVTDTGIG